MSDQSFWLRLGHSPTPYESARMQIADELVRNFLTEARQVWRGENWRTAPAAIASGRAILSATPDLRSAIFVLCVDRVVAGVENKWGRPDVFELSPVIEAISDSTTLESSDLDHVLRRLGGQINAWDILFPTGAIARCVKAGMTADQPTRARIELIEQVCATVSPHHLLPERKQIHDQLSSLIGHEAPLNHLIDRGDDWGEYALQALAEMDPELRPMWSRLLEHAATAVSPRPSAKWNARASEHVNAIGEDRFVKTALAWLGLLHRPASGAYRLGHWGRISTLVLKDQNGAMLKGIIWMCALSPDPAIPTSLHNAAKQLFSSVRSTGPRSAKAGNACIVALGLIPGVQAAAQLARLDHELSHMGARKLVKSTLDAAAERAGVTRAMLDDLIVPTFDLVDGSSTTAVGGYEATMALDNRGRLSLTWRNSSGKPVTSLPASLKRSHADSLAEIKRRTKEIEGVVAAQRARLDRVALLPRVWRHDDWRRLLLDHPLLSVHARRLIWVIEGGGESTGVAWLDGELVDLDDQPHKIESPDALVRLFHPMDAPLEVAAAWRQWIERHRLTQPFKQAHREVYSPTVIGGDRGERSEAFAGHVLKQHQFAKLCKQRGWLFTQHTGAGYPNDPAKLVITSELAAIFGIKEIDGEKQQFTSSILLDHVSTGSLQFIDGDGEPIPVVDVNPRVFSEVSRDLDLFTSVCGIGDDPEWFERHNDDDGVLWRNYAFRGLLESDLVRRDVLERLIPALPIANRCAMQERSLKVNGDLKTYVISLTSATVVMQPDNAHLDIQPKRGAAADEQRDLYLPFEGDSMLSLILSKAILLANDTAINDPEIRARIDR